MIWLNRVLLISCLLIAGVVCAAQDCHWTVVPIAADQTAITEAESDCIPSTSSAFVILCSYENDPGPPCECRVNVSTAHEFTLQGAGSYAIVTYCGVEQKRFEVPGDQSAGTFLVWEIDLTINCVKVCSAFGEVRCSGSGDYDTSSTDNRKCDTGCE